MRELFPDVVFHQATSKYSRTFFFILSVLTLFVRPILPIWSVSSPLNPIHAP